MAKKELIPTNLFSKTGDPEPQPLADDPARKRRRKNSGDPVVSKGIGLRQSEWAKFEGMANDLGTNYHDLGVYVIMQFMAAWARGERPPTETKQVLKR